jgi:hypothetical protein
MRLNLLSLSMALLLTSTSCGIKPGAVEADSPSVFTFTQPPTVRPSGEQAIAPTPSDAPSYSGAYASASEEVNVRSGPGTMFEVVGKLMPGLQYAVTGKDNEWLRLVVDGNPAWVFSTLVTLSGDPSSIPDLMATPSQGSQATATFEGKDAAIAHIRSFLERPNLTLTFVELTLMINSPNADRQVAVFQDQLETRYSVDPSTFVLTQIEPSGLHSPSGNPLSPDVVRQMARDLAESSPGFLKLAPTLQYEEGQKDGLHFFIWTDTKPGWKFNRPQLQVGISDDGTLFTYMNTLIWTP